MSDFRVILTERDLTLIHSALDKLVEWQIFQNTISEPQRLAIAQRVEQVKEKLLKDEDQLKD